MPQYATTEVKSDEASGTEQYVCGNCGEPVSGRVTVDAVGNRTASYRCPTHGHRLRSELVRATGDV